MQDFFRQQYEKVCLWLTATLILTVLFGKRPELNMDPFHDRYNIPSIEWVWKASWWLNQPLWNICKSQNGFIFRNFAGWKFQEIFETDHHREKIPPRELATFWRSEPGSVSNSLMEGPLVVLKRNVGASSVRVPHALFFVYSAKMYMM